MHIDFQKCREKIAASLNEFCNRWYKREHVERDALKVGSCSRHLDSVKKIFLADFD